MNTVIGIPFVGHVCQVSRPTIENPKEFLKTRFGCINDIMKSGYYKLMGYKYNFKPYLKNYLYKQDGEWHEVFAPNKTLLRQTIWGRIDKIIELKN